MAIHNLDDQVQEYFDFTVLGNKYRFRHMTTDEVDEWSKLSDPQKSKEYLFKFIDKVDQNSPDFSEISKKMITPHWLHFNAMVKVEFGM